MFSNSIGVIGAASYDKYYTAEDGSVLRTHQNLAAHETFQFHHIQMKPICQVYTL